MSQPHRGRARYWQCMSMARARLSLAWHMQSSFRLLRWQKREPQEHERGKELNCTIQGLQLRPAPNKDVLPMAEAVRWSSRHVYCWTRAPLGCMTLDRRLQRSVVLACRRSPGVVTLGLHMHGMPDHASYSSTSTPRPATLHFRWQEQNSCAADCRHLSCCHCQSRPAYT